MFTRLSILLQLSCYVSTLAREGPIDWVRANGGYVNEKQDMKMDPSIPHNRGIYATSSIGKGEVLLSIPAALTFRGREEDYCSVVKALAREITLANESRFWPYLEDVQTVPVTVPAAWQWQEPVFTPATCVRDTSFELYGECETQDEIHLRAHLLLYNRAINCRSSGTRNLNVCLIPVLDLYNHRNGHWLNTKVLEGEQGAIKVLASRDIAAHEQIYNSYGPYTTSNLFCHYGFMEETPQRWMFKTQEKNPIEHLWTIADNEGTVLWAAGARERSNSFILWAEALLEGPLKQPGHGLQEHSSSHWNLSVDVKLASTYREAVISAVQLALKKGKAANFTSKCGDDDQQCALWAQNPGCADAHVLGMCKLSCGTCFEGVQHQEL